jgi:hypothetical protein
VARDPPAGARSTRANSTVSFFGGKFVVHVGSFGNNGETVVVDLSVRLGDYPRLLCQEGSVRLGQGLVVKDYIRPGGTSRLNFYRADLRAFRAGRLDLVAYAVTSRPSGRLVRHCAVAGPSPGFTSARAKALCRDGEISETDSVLDTCRRHDGVGRWLD